MNKSLQELIEISNKVGRDVRLIQGAGGNTSVKSADGKYMYIKASGTALKDMSGTSGWRKMNVEMVLDILGDKELAGLETNAREAEVVERLLRACVDRNKSGARPSVEAPLHAMLGKYVIHLHPQMVGAYVSAKNGRTELEKLFSVEKYPPLWVPYADPGFTLANKVGRLVGDYRKKFETEPEILFLDKHGVFVTAASSSRALAVVRKVAKVCGEKLKCPKLRKSKASDKFDVVVCKSAIRKAVFETTGQYQPVVFYCDDLLVLFAKDKGTKELLRRSSLTPDELVYSNGPAMWVENCDGDKLTAECGKRIKKSGRCPAAFLVGGLGLFVSAETKLAPVIRDIQSGSLFVRYNAKRLGGIRALTDRQRDFVNNWEAEAFRKKLAQAEPEGQLKGQIAVVTGAGSGLGRSIAIGLARTGALVAPADIDIKAAQQTEKIIKNENGSAEAFALHCDVTDERSVEGAYRRLMDRWGGLDILVNAAGVAPPYPLVDLPVEKFRLALEVNLTGYVLMAKHAARIMIQQGIGGNIINLSSKSGLEASIDNTPYNATKAAELHIARGWAKELGRHGIRVNCVCPGNVFEGSKIWNPTYIRACAKKYGIKPEEVIPYYVNKTVLKKEISGQDVADSIVFLCSKRARTITGQIIVPDAGQVMVR